MSTQKSFIDWLQQELQRRGWNQAELARRSRITTAQVSRIMTGEQQPGPTVSRAFARALHLPPEEVFRRAGLLPPARPQPEGAEELLYHYSYLGEEDRTRLLAFARTLHKMSEQGTPD